MDITPFNETLHPMLTLNYKGMEMDMGSKNERRKCITTPPGT